MMKTICILLFILTTGTSMLAQDLKADFQSMYTLLDGLASYELGISYSAGDSSDLADKNEISAYVSKQGFFYDLGFSTIVTNATHTLVIDPSEKTIIYSDNKEDKQKTLQGAEMLLQSMDTLLTHADSVYFSLSGNTKNYYLRFKGGYFELVHLEFQNDFLSKATYFYNAAYVEKPGLKAVCNVTLTKEPAFDAQLLNTAYYMSGVSGAMKPSEAFSSYLLIYNESVEGLND